MPRAARRDGGGESAAALCATTTRLSGVTYWRTLEACVGLLARKSALKWITATAGFLAVGVIAVRPSSVLVDTNRTRTDAADGVDVNRPDPKRSNSGSHTQLCLGRHQ